LPTYDYQCGACRHKFEIKQSFQSEPVADCPECGQSAQRLFHSPTVIYKGSGWYVTDYAKKPMQIGKDSSLAGSEKSGNEKDNSSEKKQDSKPKGSVDGAKKGTSDGSGSKSSKSSGSKASKSTNNSES